MTIKLEETVDCLDNVYRYLKKHFIVSINYNELNKAVFVIYPRETLTKHIVPIGNTLSVDYDDDSQIICFVDNNEVTQCYKFTEPKVKSMSEYNINCY